LQTISAKQKPVNDRPLLPLLLLIFIIWRVAFNLALPITDFTYYALACFDFIPAFSETVVTRHMVIHYIWRHKAFWVACH